MCAVAGGIAAAGELLLPTSGAAGFLARSAALLAIVPALWAAGFFAPGELDAVRGLRARLRGLSAARRPGADPG